MENLVRVVWRQVRVNTNWKFSADNFNESYHLPAVHPQMSEYIDEDYRTHMFEMYPSGHNRVVEQGKPSLRAKLPNEVEPLWEAQLREWGLDPADFAGRSREARPALIAAKRRLGPERGYTYFDRLSDEELVDAFHHTLFPNVTLTGDPNGVHFFRTEPDPKDPEWCTFDYWFLAPRVEGRNELFTVAGLTPFESAQLTLLEYGVDEVGDFVDQDLSVAVAQQNGFHSRGYGDAYLNGQEDRVRRFHEVLNDYLEGRR
jgi:phenylpropionate dioxygenase-like ring-hydroxylating dioxygenase large terminal subunit